MGLFTKGSTEKICKYVLKERERGFQKGVQETLLQIPEGFTIAVQDESIFVHDVIVRRKLWLPKGGSRNTLADPRRIHNSSTG
jgi:hypothetical protein